ncbi:Ada DNA repair metal-binding [Penicillium capsulatum]|uniref:Ada DNA repair metal-binding n=1 Tax=Penicillium capsulatum TaxID=69766 RepID=A0A9W9IQA3_9EURO|nr:Ada DNA repair metal-binding [Penicillium capsulatum]
MIPSYPTPQEIPRLSRSRDALTSAERWQAISNRDATIDSFVYAVVTTKIYCRPSCAARLARRANVQFYDSPTQAERAGFRPCKRCRPQTGRTAVQNNPQITMVKAACEALREQTAAGLKPRLQDLAAQAGLTPSHFHRVFKKHMGVTPGHFAGILMNKQRRVDPSSGSPTNSGLSGLETPRLDALEGTGKGALGLDVSEVAFPGAGRSGMDEEISPTPMEYMWNEFDDLLSVEQGLTLPVEVGFVDPRILSASDVRRHE